ncbi:hypothetical protein [Actinocorallia populi]|uniref:hypothetical protein n=1 Tax=Actinocorallia populi TaxID=2079200 RepID=UPI000D086BE3|nr:hypothetical protein [Actinocorallia populi]
MTDHGFAFDPGAARQALALLRPEETEDPAPSGPPEDPAHLAGRLVAAVELAAGSGGRCRDWSRFDEGYRSVLPEGQRSTVALKRLMRTVRELTGLPGVAARGAATGLLASTSVLFAEILMADDRTELGSALEQLEEARALFGQTVTQLDGLTGMLRDSLSPG